VTDDKSQPLREYVGFMWTFDEPGIRLRVQARSLREAKAAVIAEYGEGHVISLWNEEDAAKPR
jgi:hypothetical protein